MRLRRAVVRRPLRGPALLLTLVLAVVVAMASATSCSFNAAPGGSSRERPRLSSSAAKRHADSHVPAQFRDPLPGMPPVIGGDVYSQTRADMLAPAVRDDPALLYVPDSQGDRVTVIDQHTRKIVRVIPVGYLSQHVVPSWDLTGLAVNSSAANELEYLNPRTGRKTGKVTVPRPYNLYYTPDGKQAVVMVEQHDTIRFSDPHSFRKIAAVRPRGCRGPNHADFSANGRWFVTTCEFSGALVKISTLGHRVLQVKHLDPHPQMSKGKHHTGGMGGMGEMGTMTGTMGRSMPQDVRLSPDGRTLFVADMGTNELRLLDAATLRQRRTIHLPSHPHGLYPSRDGSKLYISDRGAGEISVLDFATERIVDTWHIPGGGSPDMGGVSADGSMLWLSGRYDGVVYGFRTSDGKLVAKIPVGGSPHGMAVWPQPGRYSLGHTGNMR